MTLSATVRKQLSSEFILDVSMELEPGITILFGASGSGKTTLLRCLAGLTKPDAGHVVAGDRVMFDHDRRVDVPVQQRRIGYLVQQLALFPHLSNTENIAYGLADLDADECRTRIATIAESFGIAPLLERTPGEISGGERQRVALARALVREPVFLLLDEPLSALDYATQGRIIADLRRWNEARRIPIVYVTHSHREVFALGERVVVLERGRILADGPPHAVMNAPTQESVAHAAGFDNVLEAAVVGVHRDLGTMECRLAGSTSHVEVPLFDASVGDAVRLAIRAGDILIASEPPRGLSARNVLPGTIAALQDHGSSIVASVNAGALLEVHLTIGAVRELHLVPGSQVWLVIKTHSFHRVS